MITGAVPLPPETPPPSLVAESETDLEEVVETSETEPEQDDLPQLPLTPLPGDRHTGALAEEEDEVEALISVDSEGIPPVPVSPVPLEELEQLDSLDLEQLTHTPM